MRLAVVTLLALTGWTASASAQTTELPWAQKIFFGVTSHDFGTCPHGAQLKYRFKMKNIYAVPLDITTIRPSCSCLTYTASSMRLQPQEEGFIDINMDATRFKGPKTVYLNVSVGPQFISTAVFQISANARPDVVFNPGEVNFGIVPAGEAAIRTIDVEYAGNPSWAITEVVKNKAAPFNIVPTQLYRGSIGLGKVGKVGYRLTLTLKTDAATGQFRQDLLLKTNDPGASVLTVVVEGTIQPSLEVQPSVVNLGTIKAGEPKAVNVFVKGKAPFHIKAIKGTGEELNTDLPNQNSQIHILNLRCLPRQEGVFQRELTIQTDLGAATVTVQATVTK
jgi:hypothetical protein